MAEPIATVGKLAGVCGHDGTDWQKVSISASKRLKVEIDDPGGTDLTDILNKLTNILTELNAKLETGDLLLDAAKRLGVNLYGWDGSEARKLNLLWGYYAIWDENLGGTAAATSWIKAATIVPAGQVWVVQAISIRNASSTAGITEIYVARAGGGTAYLAYAASRLSGEPLVVTGQFSLAAGDRVYVGIFGIAVGNIIQSAICGYKMRVDQ